MVLVGFAMPTRDSGPKDESLMSKLSCHACLRALTYLGVATSTWKHRVYSKYENSVETARRVKD